MKDNRPGASRRAESDKGMNGLTQMFAYGWPLALAGFLIGGLAGGWAVRRWAVREGGRAYDAPDAGRLAALAEELQTARGLLEAEETDAQETEQMLKELDEAVKRANGRLKLLSKTLNPPK